MSRRKRIGYVGFLVCVPITLFAIASIGGLRVNLTPSYPVGLWQILPLDRAIAVGDLVFMCPPETDGFALAFERGYLRAGLCPGWYSPLIKSVAAGPGQTIEVGDTVSIDGSNLAHSQVRERDPQGRMLTPYRGGTIPPDHFYLHSDFAGSYDSRYFGPIPTKGLLGLAQPVLTISP